MNPIPKAETSRSEFIRILSQEILKSQNVHIYEQLPHINIEQLYQHYLIQNIATEEFAVRFVSQLNNLCSLNSGIAFAGLLIRRHCDLVRESLPGRHRIKLTRIQAEDQKVCILS